MLAFDAPVTGSSAAPELDAAGRRARALGSSSLTLVGFGGVLLGARLLSIHAPACPFRTMTGVPCPGCGMTRLAATVAHGNVATAVAADAAGVALIVVLAVLAGAHLHGLVTKRPHPPTWMRSWLLPAALVALVAIHWAINIVTGGPPPL